MDTIGEQGLEYLIACAITVTFGVLRFIVPVTGKINRQDVFKDLAHIWVGVLIGLALHSGLFWFPMVFITVVEVVAFFVRKGGK